MIGIIGDVHGYFDILMHILQKHPEVTRWFQVGDLGDVSLTYPELPSNFHFIQGNHENWDEIEDYRARANPVYIQNGDILKFEDGATKYTVGVMGGNYSSKFYGCKRRELCGDRRRHFVEQEVASLVSQANKLDILLTHEAPVLFQKGGREMGQEVIADLLRRTHPDTHFFGHHHYYSMRELEGTVSVGLEYAIQSYVLYDVSSGRVDHRDL